MRILILFAIISLTACRSTSASDDRVTELDGYYNFSNDFEIYSGYLVLQDDPLINIHYVFVTSMRSPKDDDVVLWLNGGPGCSSLLGFAQYLGPCLLNQGSKSFSQRKNIYSWNNRANMLFFESPPGIGFSINNDYNYGFNESRTASDNVLAIKLWFYRFPQFSSNKFWISGESYCGMYIPYLASALLKVKDTLLPTGTINFQGMLIGNGVMLTELNWRRKAIDTFYSRHYFYGPEITQLLANCKYTADDLLTSSCIIGKKLADQAVKDVNTYATTGICYWPTQGETARGRFWYTPFNKEAFPNLNDEPDCSSDDFGITKFFNNKKVQSQLHVDTTITWATCKGIDYHKGLTTIPLFEYFKANNLKILLYSGNTDAQVSYVYTEEYIRQIGWRRVTGKYPMVNDKGSLMGWVTQYDGLSFVVINGAGHMVPSDKPNAAYYMFDWFLSRSW